MMLAPRTIPIPQPSLVDFANFSDSSPLSNAGSYDFNTVPQRFPHTRAQLAAIARQHKDSYDSDVDDETGSRLSSEFVSRIVSLLDAEHEEQLKAALVASYPGIEDDALEQHVLDLMHKHRDDIAGVPFMFLTPTRRPISRPSSRASNPSARLVNRPENTTSSAPSSPLAYVFRRPHTPAASPLTQSQPSSWAAAHAESPSSSPVLASSSPVLIHFQSHLSASLPASPLSSPRLLNAKASEFRPIPRPLSAASSNPASLSALRAETPSPDLWAHSTTRTSSNLAIAAPLTPDLSYSSRANTPNSGLRSSISPRDDDDEDPFDPFASNSGPLSFSDSRTREWTVSEDDELHFPSIQNHYHQRAAPPTQQLSYESSSNQDSSEEMDPEAAAMLTDGMTPIDVLSSVFGATLAPSELEEALANNGYDFDQAMNWLVDKALPTPNQQSVNPVRMQQLGGRVTLVSRDGNGAVGFAGKGNGRFANNRAVPGGNRVCRYFLAGECLRADCRFSHDLERALCRFWLRGTCAKGETCEFLHHLPQNIDVNGITAAITRTDLNNSKRPNEPSSPPPDEFPTLDHANGINQGGGKAKRGGVSVYGPQNAYNDPGRTRFSAAVKKPAPPPSARDPASIARREALGPAAEPLHHRTAIVAPKPSPRLKLRPPSLLPTLPTGESVNNLYMGYRSRALQLGAARNACLSRAADAWRRGDGAAAKRFSREGHELNGKMSAEMGDAAGQLVKERAKVAEQAVKARDASWSDDPGDRSARGKICGGGLGVCLGIASTDINGGEKSTPEERTEAALDLHGLHANEATDVLEKFLLALEKDHFYGLAYAIVGEEKHTGSQDPARGASRVRLATGVREWLHMWGYPWSERGDGIICIDPLTHA